MWQEIFVERVTKTFPQTDERYQAVVRCPIDPKQDKYKKINIEAQSRKFIGSQSTEKSLLPWPHGGQKIPPSPHTIGRAGGHLSLLTMLWLSSFIDWESWGIVGSGCASLSESLRWVSDLKVQWLILKHGGSQDLFGISCNPSHHFGSFFH